MCEECRPYLRALPWSQSARRSTSVFGGSMAALEAESGPVENVTEAGSPPAAPSSPREAGGVTATRVAPVVPLPSRPPPEPCGQCDVCLASQVRQYVDEHAPDLQRTDGFEAKLEALLLHPSRLAQPRTAQARVAKVLVEFARRAGSDLDLLRHWLVLEAARERRHPCASLAAPPPPSLAVSRVVRQRPRPLPRAEPGSRPPSRAGAGARARGSK